jgi:hypothetical protein
VLQPCRAGRATHIDPIESLRLEKLHSLLLVSIVGLIVWVVQHSRHSPAALA